MALICDTGPLYAAMDRNDQDHEVCADLLTSAGEPLLVPAPVLVELDWLASARLGPAAFDSLLADIEDGLVRIVDLTRADLPRVRQLCAQYADLPLGYVDASVLAVVERLGEHKVATLDRRHFSVVRLRHTSTLNLQPFLT